MPQGKKTLSAEMIESARISGIKGPELADELGLHPSTIYQFCKFRGIPPLKGGHRDVIERCLAHRLPEYFKVAMWDYCRPRKMHPRDLIMVAVTEYMIRSGINPHGLKEGGK